MLCEAYNGFLSTVLWQWIHLQQLLFWKCFKQNSEIFQFYQSPLKILNEIIYGLEHHVGKRGHD